MIITQRGFQEGLNIVTASDEMLETLINLKRQKDETQKSPAMSGIFDWKRLPKNRIMLSGLFFCKVVVIHKNMHIIENFYPFFC